MGKTLYNDYNKDKKAIKLEVVTTIFESIQSKSDDEILELLNDTLYHEKERLKKYSHLYKDTEHEKKFFNTISKGLSNYSGKQLREALRCVIEHYVDEICGNFNPFMYKISTYAVPKGLTLLLNTLSPMRLIKQIPQIPTIESTVKISGNIDKLKKLKKKNSVFVYVPEHLSNLDSPVLGYSLYKAGLPPVLYGAGLNLFQLPVFPFFMNRLGAYKVDRLKKASLYKKTLKTFARITLEFGYDHLFFPGGTRIRSGGIESHLKKGLLSTVLDAYVSSLKKGKNINFYIVPVTLSYHLVLEAKTLIEDFLKETGKSRYIIIDDESSKPSMILNFVKRLLSLEGKVYVNFCDPFDPFGNRVLEDGRSIDLKGRVIDISGYVKKRGKVVVDPQRDSVYIRELEEKIIDSYRKNTLILITNVVSYSLFELFFKGSTSGDLFKFLRDEAFNLSVPFEDAVEHLTKIKLALIKLKDQGMIKLEPAVLNLDASDMILKVIRYFSGFHKDPVIVRKGNRLFTQNPDLLYYYSNRVKEYESFLKNTKNYTVRSEEK